MKMPKMISIPSKKVVVDEYAKAEKAGKREIDPRPEFSVNEETLPDIKDWSVGKKYMIEIEAEMIGSRIEDWGDDKGKLKANFKISGIAINSKDAMKKGSEMMMNKGGEMKKENMPMKKKEMYPEAMKVTKK